MEATKHIISLYTLKLNKIEAEWLKALMQNPLHCEEIEDESQTDRTMRKIFFDALKEAGAR